MEVDVLVCSEYVRPYVIPLAARLLYAEEKDRLLVLLPQSSAGEQLDDAPVSYTHLTLPTKA